MMKKIFCGSAIALLGTIYSVTFIVMATINRVYRSGVSGLWGAAVGIWCGASVCIILSCCGSGDWIMCLGHTRKGKIAQLFGLSKNGWREYNA